MKNFKELSSSKKFNFKNFISAFIRTIYSYPFYYFLFLFGFNFIFLSITLNLFCSVVLSLFISLGSLIYRKRGYFKTLYLLESMMDFELKPYFEKWKKDWVIKFEKEKERIEKHIDHSMFALNPGVIHIGSTSIQDISLSTLTIDMGLFLNQKINDRFIQQMEELGYDYIGAAVHDPNGYDHWFMKIGQDFSIEYDLHAVEPNGHENLKKIKAFSEYLSRFPKEREKYEEYKLRSMKNNDNYRNYKMGKQKLVEELKSKAYDWYQNQPDIQIKI